MIENQDKYRPCVGIMLFNEQGHIFVGRRFDSEFFWQMPQGGIHKSEELEQAALRELLEEIGTNKVEIIAKNKSWIRYNTPNKLVPLHWNGKFSGQKQRWILMKFCGGNQDVNINYSSYPEFKEWRWQHIGSLAENAISFKREVYKRVIKEFYFKVRHSIKNGI